MSNLEQSLFERNYNKLSESKRDKLDDKFNCFICDLIIKNGAPLFCYQCQKIYHEDCLKDWDKKLKSQNRELECPFCKNQLPLKKWHKKLNYEESRKTAAEIMNKMNNYESNINKNQTSNNEKTFDIFKKILNKIKTIESLVKIELDNKLKNTIYNIDKNRKFLEINDVSSVIYEELEKIEYNIRHNKDK